MVNSLEIFQPEPWNKNFLAEERENKFVLIHNQLKWNVVFSRNKESKGPVKHTVPISIQLCFGRHKHVHLENKFPESAFAYLTWLKNITSFIKTMETDTYQ